MAKRTARKPRKSSVARGPGRPVTTGTGQLIGIRCHPPFLDAVDRWRKDLELSRPAAIVKLAEVGLKTEGA